MFCLYTKIWKKRLASWIFTESKRLVEAYSGSQVKIIFLIAGLNQSKTCRLGRRYQYPALMDA